MIISDAAIRNRTTVGVLAFIIVVAGVYSYVTLPREAAPDVPIPIVLIRTSYEGVSPADVESSVTMKIETKLTGLKGVKEIRSSSAEGESLITVEFLPKVRIEDALQYVRDKVDQAKDDLPDDPSRNEPVVTEINVADFPILIINLSGPISQVRLKAIADDLEDVIEEIPGVLNCDVAGGLEREIRLEIDAERVAAYGLTIPEIIDLIPSENVNISAGGLETPGTKFNVRLPAEFVKPEQVDHLPLTNRNGKVIHLADVARVTDTFKDRATLARLNGRPTITLSVQKRVGENIIRIADHVKAILQEAEKSLPEGVRFDIVLDLSKYIRNTVSDLENNMAAAFFLVLVVLLLFMGLRTSLIVAVAVPTSMLMGFAVLNALGYTLNMIVLFALTLAVGMLVDNAIVIVENIYRHMQLGYGRVEAAMKGTAEVAWPVITSTLTTVVAFVPLTFWPGITGDFMKYLPITVIIVLSSSLFVAMVISPTICAAIGPGKVKAGDRRHPFLAGYRRLLRTALGHRFATLSVTVLLLVGLILLYKKRQLGVEYFPEADPDRALINIRCPQGTNVSETDRLAGLVERRIGAVERDYDYLVTNVGASGGRIIFGGATGGPHMANLTIVFPDFEIRRGRSADVLAEVRRRLTDLAGAEIKVQEEEHGPPTGEAVTVRIMGKDFATLEDLSEQAKVLMAGVPGLVDLRSDLEATRPELAFDVDRYRANMLGVNAAVVGHYLKTAIFGRKVGTYRQFNDEYDITVRLPVEDRSRIDDVLNLHVPNASGHAVPLSSLGAFEYTGGFGTINRVNQKRAVSVTGGAQGRLDTAVLADVQDRLDPSGPTALIMADVLDYGRILTDIAGAAGPQASPMGRHIRSLLKARERRRVEELAGKDDLSPEEKNDTLEVLNDVLARRDLSPAAPADAAGLPDQARDLLNRKDDLSRGQTRRLNRLLLEAAWPGAFVQRQALKLPAGYEVRYVGKKEEQDKAQAFLGKAFAVALMLIVLILIAQFNTFTVPLIIMTTVVLSLIGVLVGLIVTGMPFGIIMTGIGVISLAGVVVNNAIVLLDYTRKLQQRGLDLVEAAVEAGATRLRPVLLTATTTVIGLLPMAVGVSFDIHTFHWVTKSWSSEWWRGMAVAVIFGLSFATVLTLVVVPTLYVTLYRLAARLGLGGLEKVAAESPRVEAAPAPVE